MLTENNVDAWSVPFSGFHCRAIKQRDLAISFKNFQMAVSPSLLNQ